MEFSGMKMQGKYLVKYAGENDIKELHIPEGILGMTARGTDLDINCFDLGFVPGAFSDTKGIERVYLPDSLDYIAPNTLFNTGSVIVIYSKSVKKLMVECIKDEYSGELKENLALVFPKMTLSATNNAAVKDCLALGYMVEPDWYSGKSKTWSCVKI